MRTNWIFWLLIALFLLLRVPVMYHQPGGQDEDCYAVPGLTILESGVPKLPHVPADNAESVYYRADQMLYSEPPLFFFWQALFYALLPQVYGTARLAATIAALIGVGFIFHFNRRTLGTDAAGLWAVGLFLFSRWFYFPATSARPDILCTTFGFIAIACMMQWRLSSQWKWLIGAGAAIGAGGLAHPFALVYAVQLAVWAMLVSKSWKRLTCPMVLAGVAVSVALLWLPLIVIYPDTFRVQFTNQFFSDQGGSLLYRLFMPWESLHYHFFGPFGMVRHINVWQTLLVIIPAIACTIYSAWKRTELRAVAWLGISSIYGICVIVGPHHPVIGYWSYTAGLLFVCTGRCVAGLFLALLNSTHGTYALRRIAATGLAMCLVASMIPGSGLTTLYTTVVHWNDLEYRAPDFARALISKLPDDAVYAVDTQFALDFIVAKRTTLLAQTYPMYFRVDQYPFDYLIVSRYGMDTKIAERLPVELIATHGNKNDLFACYCEVYRRKEKLENDPQSNASGSVRTGTE